MGPYKARKQTNPPIAAACLQRQLQVKSPYLCIEHPAEFGNKKFIKQKVIGFGFSIQLVDTSLNAVETTLLGVVRVGV